MERTGPLKPDDLYIEIIDLATQERTAFLMWKEFFVAANFTVDEGHRYLVQIKPKPFRSIENWVAYWKEIEIKSPHESIGFTISPKTVTLMMKTDLISQSWHNNVPGRDSVVIRMRRLDGDVLDPHFAQWLYAVRTDGEIYINEWIACAEPGIYVAEILASQDNAQNAPALDTLVFELTPEAIEKGEFSLTPQHATAPHPWKQPGRP